MLGTELLAGSRVRLSRLYKTDAPTIAAWYADPQFMRLYDAEVAFRKSEEQIAAEIEAAERSAKAFMFGIRRVGDGTLLGRASIDGILWHNGVAWLSIALGPAYWGQGFGSESMELLLRYAFSELNLC